jgi:hypothetical protein
LPGFAGLGITGGSVSRCFKACIAEATAAAFYNRERFAGSGKILDNFTGSGIFDERAGWNFDDQIRAVSTGLLLALTMGAFFGFKLALELKWIKGAAV